MKDSLAIKILYNTIIGRTLLKGLVNPKVSKVAACFLSSRCSFWLVPLFIRKNGVDICQCEIPSGGYRSFNDFFTRKLNTDYFIPEQSMLIAPSDGLLTVSEIDDDSIFRIKHTEYCLEELLKNKNLADEYVGGTALIFRLTPAHYHRYVYCASGAVTDRKRVNGVLHSVQPICHEKTKVFVQNSREYIVIDNNPLGKVIQMEIGALLVGKISNTDNGEVANRGKEKGYFEYGGSSIVVLVNGKVELPESIKAREPVSGGEIPITLGEMIM